MINIIVATDQNGVIGKDNGIPWHLPADLKLFKQRTTGSGIIMGRATWDSLPKKPLPNRINCVISRTKTDGWFQSLAEAIDYLKNKTKDIFIIGGEQIYALALQQNLVDSIILTRVKGEYEGDKFFFVPPEWEARIKEENDGFDVFHYWKSHEIVRSNPRSLDESA